MQPWWDIGGMFEDNYWSMKSLATDTLIRADASMSLYIELGKNIVAVRQSKGLEQQDLAALTVMTLERVRNVENPTRFNTRASALMIWAIAQALGVCVAKLLPNLELIKAATNEQQKVYSQEGQVLSLKYKHDVFRFNAQLGMNLNNKRRQAGLSLEELANRLGGNLILKRKLMAIENNETLADIFLFVAIAHVLQVSLEELFPPVYVDRVGAFVAQLHASDVFVLKQMLCNDRAGDLLLALEKRLSEFPTRDEESCIARGVFFAGAG